MTLMDCVVIGLTWILAAVLGLALRGARDAQRHEPPTVVLRGDLRVEVPLTVTLPAPAGAGEISVQRCCALPGCDEPVGPHQTYCTPAHRQAAYRARQAAAEVVE